MGPAATLTLTAAVLAFGPVMPLGALVPAPAVPAPAPVPAPPAPPAEPPASQIHTMVPIRWVEAAGPAVAITFDACATRSFHYAFDRELFNIVKREQVPMTMSLTLDADGAWRRKRDPHHEKRDQEK